MAGALNKLPVAVSGMIFFSAPVTFFSVTAVMIGIVTVESILMN
jgi:GDP-mannose transporter